MPDNSSEPPRDPQDIARALSELPDPRSAEPTRTYDYHLGGKDNTAADRRLIEEIERDVMPDVKQRVRAQRRFLERAVRYLVGEAGIRQILDIGSGTPQPRGLKNVDELAHELAPETRVAYVDSNRVAVASMDAQQVTSDLITAFVGDVRRPREILDHPQARALFDFGRPIGVLLVGVLHFIPDEDRPAEFIARLRDGLPPGSHLVTTNVSTELDPRLGEVTRRWEKHGGGTRMVPRSRAALERILAGFEWVEPAWVANHEWRPDSAHPEQGNGYGIVARKP